MAETRSCDEDSTLAWLVELERIGAEYSQQAQAFITRVRKHIVQAFKFRSRHLTERPGLSNRTLPRNMKENEWLCFKKIIYYSIKAEHHQATNHTPGVIAAANHRPKMQCEEFNNDSSEKFKPALNQRTLVELVLHHSFFHHLVMFHLHQHLLLQDHSPWGDINNSQETFPFARDISHDILAHGVVVVAVLCHHDWADLLESVIIYVDKTLFLSFIRTSFRRPLRLDLSKKWIWLVLLWMNIKADVILHFLRTNKKLRLKLCQAHVRLKLRLC